MILHTSLLATSSIALKALSASFLAVSAYSENIAAMKGPFHASLALVFVVLMDRLSSLPRLLSFVWEGFGETPPIKEPGYSTYKARLTAAFFSGLVALSSCAVQERSVWSLESRRKSISFWRKKYCNVNVC